VSLLCVWVVGVGSWFGELGVFRMLLLFGVVRGVFVFVGGFLGCSYFGGGGVFVCL